MKISNEVETIYLPPVIEVVVFKSENGFAQSNVPIQGIGFQNNNFGEL